MMDLEVFDKLRKIQNDKKLELENYKKVKKFTITLLILHVLATLGYSNYRDYKIEKIDKYIEAHDIDNLRKINKNFITKHDYLLYETLEECLESENISKADIEDVIKTIKSNEKLNILIDTEDPKYGKINLQTIFVNIINDIHQNNPDFDFSLMNYHLKEFSAEFESRDDIQKYTKNENYDNYVAAYCEHSNKRIVFTDFKDISGDTTFDKIKNFRGSAYHEIMHLRNYYQNGNRLYSPSVYRENNKLENVSSLAEATTTYESGVGSGYYFETNIVFLLDMILDYDQEIDLYKEFREGNVKTIINSLEELYIDDQESITKAKEIIELLEIYFNTSKTKVVDDINSDIEFTTDEYPLSNHASLYNKMFELISLSEQYKLNNSQKSFTDYVNYSKNIYIYSNRLKTINSNSFIGENNNDIIDKIIKQKYIDICIDGMKICGIQSEKIFIYTKEDNLKVILPVDINIEILKNYNYNNEEKIKIKFTLDETVETLLIDDEIYITTNNIKMRDYYNYVLTRRSLPRNDINEDYPNFEIDHFSGELMEDFLEKQNNKTY